MQAMVQDVGLRDSLSRAEYQLTKNQQSLGDKAIITDKVTIDGRLIDLGRFSEEETKVLILNKQAGVICSNKDEEGRKSVFEFLPDNTRWVMVGRLDLNTSGLLLFTNNGELANKLMHPSSQIDREYAVRVLGKVEDEHIKMLTNGIDLEDGFAKFHRVTIGGGEGCQSLVSRSLERGKKKRSEKTLGGLRV